MNLEQTMLALLAPLPVQFVVITLLQPIAVAAGAPNLLVLGAVLIAMTECSAAYALMKLIQSALRLRPSTGQARVATLQS